MTKRAVRFAGGSFCDKDKDRTIAVYRPKGSVP